MNVLQTMGIVDLHKCAKILQDHTHVFQVRDQISKFSLSK